jgi:hypothetical protein
MLIFSETQSQNTATPKPKIFSNFPDIINCSESELSKVFSASVDQNVTLSFSDNFLFSGAVTGNVVKYANLQSAVIKSPVFGDAIFALSKITNANGSINYIGRIINKKYFDGYELKKNELNNYQLIKIETDKVIQDCSHN